MLSIQCISNKDHVTIFQNNKTLHWCKFVRTILSGIHEMIST